MRRVSLLKLYALAPALALLSSNLPAENRPARGARPPSSNGQGQNLFPKDFVPQQPQNNRNLSGQDAATIIQNALIQGARQNQQNQQNNQNQRPNGPRFDFVPPESVTRPRPNNRPQYIPQQPNNYVPQPNLVPQRTVPQQPQYIPSNTPPVVVNPRPNVAPPNIQNTLPPPPKLEPLVDNPPALEPLGLALVGGEDYTAIRDAIDESIATDVEELGTIAGDLGVAGDDGVKQALADIQQQVANGEAVSDEAIAAYTEALENAVTDKSGMLTDDDIKKIASATEDLQTRSEIALLFDPDFPADGFDPTLPSEDLSIAVLPGLPPGQIYILPGGSLLTGADEGGEIVFYQTTTADLLGVPVGPGDATYSDVSSDSRGVRIYNSPDSGAAVNFAFGGKSYSLEPDRWEHINPQSSREIQFDPGNGGAPTRYSLADGTYVFSGVDGQWQLANRKFTVIVENKRQDGSFYYQADGVPTELGPGASQEHTGIYPVVIRFNRGKEGEEAERCFYDAEVRASLALRPADQLWDLFRTEVVQSPAPEAETARAAEEPKRKSSSVFDPSAFDKRKKKAAPSGSDEPLILSDPSEEPPEPKKASSPAMERIEAARKKKTSFDLTKFRKALKAE